MCSGDVRVPRMLRVMYRREIAIINVKIATRHRVATRLRVPLYRVRLRRESYRLGHRYLPPMTKSRLSAAEYSRCTDDLILQ